MLEGLLGGVENVFQLTNLIILLAGTFIGFLGGAIPGISGTMLVILLVPVTYGFDAIPAFLLLTCIYATGVFSGSITAILFRTPGSSEAVATVFDGYTMASRGEAGKALGIAIFSSVIGGLVGTLFLIFLTPFLASIAVQFSSPEYFAIALLGLTVVASLSQGRFLQGLLGALFGLFIATIGVDPFSGVSRFSFDHVHLKAGLDFNAMLIGLFAISEVLRKCQEKYNPQGMIKKESTRLPGFKLIKQISGVITRSSLLGTFIGILPGAGATTAAMLSYSEAVRWSKKPEQFGTGIPEGIAAPESANNAAAMGAMIPLLSLGIPGSATTAVILGAFILHGIQPGPLMFTMQADLAYSIFIGLLLSVVLILLLARPFIALFSRILVISYSIMGPFIILFCILGTYAVNNSVFDMWVMLAFGLLGYLFDKVKFPVAPIVLGIVLGPLVEEEFRRSLQMTNGDISIFFERPLALVILLLALLSLLLPAFRSIINQFRSTKAS